MARQVARQFCRLGEVHSLVYGRRASSENGRKLTTSTRVGSETHLMDYLGSYLFHRIRVLILILGHWLGTLADVNLDRLLRLVAHYQNGRRFSRRQRRDQVKHYG